jgi:hypothetical protein
MFRVAKVNSKVFGLNLLRSVDWWIKDLQMK